MLASKPHTVRQIGRYLLYGPIASGGMATVHFGALMGEVGFSRTVAIKRLRERWQGRRELERSLVDEARLASRIHHPNVVRTLDVVVEGGELFIVLEYITGESLARLMGMLGDERMPIDVASAIMSGVLHGLHAAHEATSPKGKPLGIVHRDVSPQNVLVGADGLARVLDFGIAQAEERLGRSRAGQVKGKPSYLAPEQLEGDATQCTDIYSAAVVLWEIVTGERLFAGKNATAVMEGILTKDIPPPSSVRPDVPAALDAIVLRGLQRRPEARFATAREFALALEEEVGVALATKVGGWLSRVAADSLTARAEQVAAMEGDAAASTTVSRVVSGELGEGSGGDTMAEAERPAAPASEVPTRQLDVEVIGETVADQTMVSASAAPETTAEISPSTPIDAPAAAPVSAVAPAPARWPILAAVTLGLGAGALAMVLSGRVDSESRSAPMAAPSVLSAVVAASAAGTATFSVAPPPTVSAAPAQPVAASIAGSTPPPRPPLTRTSATAAPSPMVSFVLPPPAPNCQGEQAYRRDADGVKVLRAECAVP